MIGYLILNKNPTCEIIRTSILLRPEFYVARKWTCSNRKVIFSTATMVTPLKGLHLLLKALSIIKNIIPDVELRLAGSIQVGIRRGGYSKFIFSLVKKYNLEPVIICESRGTQAEDAGTMKQIYESLN